MAKLTPKQLEEQIKKQNEDFGDIDDIDLDEYGKDTEEDLEKVIGNEPDPEEDGFSIAEEIDDDEEDIRMKDSPDDTSDEEDDF